MFEEMARLPVAMELASTTYQICRDACLPWKSVISSDRASALRLNTTQGRPDELDYPSFSTEFFRRNECWDYPPGALKVQLRKQAEWTFGSRLYLSA